MADELTTPTREHLLDRLRSFLSDERGIDPGEVTEDAHFVDDIGLDSLDLLVLTQRWAVEYDISFDDEVVFDITTVGQALTFVIAKLEDRPQA